MKPKLLIVTGPTASGKTDASIRIAKAFGGEIVGCDSMQIYRGMDIGTGKIMPDERAGIAHYMIDIVDPSEAFSVGRYKGMAETCIQDIVDRGRVPVLVGGTGLYIRALLSGLNFGETDTHSDLRAQLRQEADRSGAQEMYARLRAVDPQSAAAIHPNDIKRVTRALEIYLSTGVPKSRIATEQADCPYDYRLFVLQDNDRAALYGRIDKRVDAMFDKGLLDEVRGLYRYRHCQSMQAIGYKELVAHMDGLCNLEEAKASIKQNSRRYAKRQVTFFKGLRYDKQYIDPATQSISAYFPSIERFLYK